MRGPDLRTHPDDQPPDATGSDSDWPVPPPPDSGGTPVTPLAGPAKVGPSPLPAVPGHRTLRRLGRGGMGEVFEALHLQLGRKVALKLLAAERADDPAWLARFRTEATAVARVRHPNVVHIYEVGDAGGRPYLSLELVTGGSLAERLRGGPLAPRAAAELARDLARGVHAVHAAGVVHRDLKPGNILLASGGGNAPGERPGALPPPLASPKIADFGLAHLADGDSDLTRTGAVLGTPSYMAPEQAAGGKGVGPPADVHALGAILYECLTGRPPFQATTALETLALVKSADPVPPGRLQPGVPRDLETVCLTCLRKEPARRYADAAALADDLQRFLNGEPVRARPVGRLGRAVKWCRRRPAAAALLAVSILAAAGGVAGLLGHQARLRGTLGRVAAEKERADANYREARLAFGQILARFDDRRYADLPRALELRNAQYEDALSFFARVVNRAADSDPEVRFDVARTRVEAARLQIALGRTAEAEANLREGIAALAALEAGTPGRAEYAAQRATALLALGSLLDPGSKPAEGRALTEEAVAVYERLLAADPGSPAYRDGLAAALTNVGRSLVGRKEWVAARPHFRRAADLRAGLVRDAPKDRRLLLALAQCHLNLSVASQTTGDAAGAAAEHGRAEAVFESLAREDPADAHAAVNLAYLRVNRAYVLMAAGRSAAALAGLDNNLALLEPLNKAEPSAAPVRDALFRTHGARAAVLTNGARYADAARAYDRAVGFAAGDKDSLLLELAPLAARGGLWRRAVEVADGLAGRVPAENAGDWLYRLPLAYGLIAAAVGRDEGLSPAERAERVAHCTRQAAAVIERARRTLPADVWREYRARLLADADFAPLKALLAGG